MIHFSFDFRVIDKHTHLNYKNKVKIDFNLIINLEMGFGLFKKVKDRLKQFKPWLQKVIPKVTEVIKKVTPVVKNLLDETPDFNGKTKVREVFDVANDGANLVDNVISNHKANLKISSSLIDWTKQNLAPRLKQRQVIDEQFDDSD